MKAKKLSMRTAPAVTIQEAQTVRYLIGEAIVPVIMPSNWASEGKS